MKKKLLFIFFINIIVYSLGIIQVGTIAVAAWKASEWLIFFGVSIIYILFLIAFYMELKDYKNKL